MKSILDKSFRYVPSGSTDIRKTFQRVRRELQKQRAAELPPHRVLPFTSKDKTRGQ